MQEREDDFISVLVTTINVISMFSSLVFPINLSNYLKKMMRMIEFITDIIYYSTISKCIKLCWMYGKDNKRRMVVCNLRLCTAHHGQIEIPIATPRRVASAAGWRLYLLRTLKRHNHPYVTPVQSFVLFVTGQSPLISSIPICIAYNEYVTKIRFMQNNLL